MRRIIFGLFLICLIAGQGLQAKADGVPGYYPSVLSSNTTGYADSFFLGAPEDSFIGIGGQEIVYDFGNVRVVNGSGNDFNVYEVDWGVVEFEEAAISASLNGIDWYMVINQAAAINLEGDEAHGDASFRQSFGLPVELMEARYIKIDGFGTGNAGGTYDFDPDAIGAVNFRDTELPPEPPVGTPEPATMLLLGLGLMGVLGMRRKIQK